MSTSGGGPDPQYVHALAVDGWSLGKIVGLVQPMSAAGPGGLDAGWAALAKDIHAEITQFSTTSATKLGETWQSKAGTLATGALTKEYAPTADQGAGAFQEVARTLTELAGAVSAVQQGVPEKIDKGFWDKVSPWDTDTEDEYYRRQGEARAALTSYNTNLVTTDGTVPGFTAPGSLSPTPGKPVISGAGGDGNNGNDGTTNSRTPSNSDGNRGTDVPGTDDPTDTSGDPTAADTADTSDTTDPSSLTDPSATSPASADATSPASADGSSRTGTGVGSGSGAGSSGGSASGGVGSHTGTGGVGGAAIGGKLAAPSAGSPSGAGLSGGRGGGAIGAAAGVGRAGAAGMGGMAGGHGARGKGDEDKEHRSPGYLVTVDNGKELIGEMPKIAPPVIGA
ncbi:hypothetical protein OG921_03590 [Aldersonia sp. NBC_00410]|uniref:hypothetical protein n=1 Tax=Aldersonia sp. NBC_00410 TaxID=2975954 RepID=UPI00225203A9|nr:hypothetical protein [Aldersonia sp. NBC_00410]MCX5042275.1 hypothetical protein [Aldersonia sp. NBC_00410]